MRPQDEAENEQPELQVGFVQTTPSASSKLRFELGELRAIKSAFGYDGGFRSTKRTVDQRFQAVA